MTTRNEPRFSVKQAAYITGLEEKGIDRLIFDPQLRKRIQSRELSERDLVFLLICNQHREDLTRTGRRRVYEALQALDHIEARLEVGALQVSVRDLLRAIKERRGEVARANRAVVENPEIFGGEPVMVGTRIPARNIADKLKRGMSPKALIAHYPTLDVDEIRLARLWCELHPTRGRPTVRPWRRKRRG